MKRVVIMGASSGIGLRVAEELAKRGVHVGLAARRTGALETLQAKYPEHVVYESIDICQPEATGQLNSLISRLGGMDIYFHVSGIGYENPTLDPETEAGMVTTNCVGFVRMISAAYCYYRAENRSGQIAALTSVAGTKGIGPFSAYSASKKMDSTYLTALEQLAHIDKCDIRFTDIRPGWIKTPLLDPDKIYPMEMSLDYIVPQIIRAIVKKERVAVIDFRWNILVGLWRMIPDCLWVRMNLPLTKTPSHKM